MELVRINKKGEKRAEAILKVGGDIKNFRFRYSAGEIFAVDLPENLRKILRPLPVSVTQALIKAIEDYVTSDVIKFPVELKSEKTEEAVRLA